MSRTRWGGAEAKKARDYWAPRLPVPCCRCGLPVIPDPSKKGDGWQPDHFPIPREFGGTETWPAHMFCNLSAGGKRGAQLTNERKNVQVRTPRTSERINNIRGV